MTLHLNLKARAVLLQVAAAGLILGVASLGANWAFSRMVLGQFDQALLELFKTEASAVLAEPGGPPHVHEMAPGAGPPSFPRLDKFIQIVDLEGRVVARSANLGSVRLPTSPGLLEQLRSGEQVLETLHDFGDEPVRMLSAPIKVGTATYAIQVAGSLDDASAALHSARLLFLISSAAILVAVGVAGALLAWAILRPIDRIVGRARVMGASAPAERRPRNRAEYEEALQSCLSEVERLSRLTEELLTLARLDAGEAQEIPTRSVPLAPILEDVVTRMASDALRRNVKIVLDAPADLTINVAPGTAALVVANVLDNAVKFSPPGGEVRVRASIEDGAVIVSVSDSGPGVTEEEIPRLFERF